jgi:hypothetical protein
MSVKHPKAEVARRRWHFCFVPKAEVRLPFPVANKPQPLYGTQNPARHPSQHHKLLIAL